VCVLWIKLRFVFVKCMYRTYSMFFNNSSCCNIQNSSVSPSVVKQIMSSFLTLCYDGSLFAWTVVSVTIAKFKPLILSMYGFALSYAANMFFLMILYDFCLSAQVCYITVYTWKIESRMQIADRCAPLENFHWCEEACFVRAAILRDRCLPLIPRRDKRKSVLLWSLPYGWLV
jgi:hypothetical protein